MAADYVGDVLQLTSDMQQMLCVFSCNKKGGKCRGTMTSTLYKCNTVLVSLQPGVRPY